MITEVKIFVDHTPVEKRLEMRCFSFKNEILFRAIDLIRHCPVWLIKGD